MALRDDILRAGLDAMYLAGLHRAFPSRWAGLGLVFMLHHIRPPGRPGDPFRPNAGLEVTPEFLDAVLERLRARGIAMISLAEAVDRLQRGGGGDGRFAVFTIDDGYLDNHEHAWPLFRAHGCPFTVFVTTGIVDGTTELWWLALEEIIRENGEVAADAGSGVETFDTASLAGKRRAYARIYGHLRTCGEAAQRRAIRALAERYGLDLAALTRREAMTWDHVREMAADPLVTIGAHTLDHLAVGRLDRDAAWTEIAGSADRIARETGRRPEFFCYPYGDPASAGPRDFALVAEAGYRAAVTTRKGLLFPEHAGHLTALPRVSLNGGFQDLRYIDLYLSGAPFALWNGFRRLHAA